MGEDVTGMTQAIAEIDPNQLGARHQRIAGALALIRDHKYSVHKAAKEAGVPSSTLYRYHHGLSTLGNESRMTAHEDALVATSMEISLIAGEKTIDRLLDDEHDWKDADLIKAHTAGAQVVANKRLWARGASGNAEGEGISVLAQLLAGKKLTVEDKDPVDEALDVTPTEDTP